VSFLLAFLGFAALIVLHEFGHFTAAKAVGMRVERFSLFFPPHIWKRRRGETEYAIGVIPLGGYVRITGMTANEEVPEEVAYRAYHRMPVWKRVVVIAAGPGMNFLIAFVILYGLYAFAGTNHQTDRVHKLEAGKPAAAVLRPGDQLVAVDGHHGSIRALSRQIAGHRCPGRQVEGCAAATAAAVTIRRAGTLRTFPITPRYDAAAGRTRLGFDFAIDHRAYGPVQAAGQSVQEMWRVSRVTVSSIAKIFYSEKARKQVSGVVGSYETTRQAITFDWQFALYILAIISLSLALVNLFPFLPLDGGHIFWALAEKVRGRAIPFAVMERASVVGFVLIICLFAIGLTNDIGRLEGQGFGIR
jgi:regulator of sigma E protease